MAIAGFNGSVKIGAATTVSDIENWSLDIEAETLESNPFDGNGWRSAVAGIKGWSGSFEGTWKVSADTTGQKALQDALLAGTTLELRFYTNVTNYYSGTAYLTSMNVETPADDLVRITFDFQGTGALAYT
ncbi:phage tail tube protein [Paenibacillus abyssi]|uniref:Phage tail protein n=1 Tax=Paenibacillus abyssi TaxID=1340531 RepID=A0A917CGM9_9BACL|nr:phage tail tube protein [Paenibacillus abyssi]GGF88483.1 hypothetical protein GCM10010916_02290 [Paenibacillus abyssi]